MICNLCRNNGYTGMVFTSYCLCKRGIELGVSHNEMRKIVHTVVDELPPMVFTNEFCVTHTVQYRDEIVFYKVNYDDLGVKELTYITSTDVTRLIVDYNKLLEYYNL